VDTPGEDASDSQGEERKLRELEARHYKLLAENNTLRHNQAICDANVQNFVREMNQLLDQHEMGGQRQQLSGESGDASRFNQRTRRP